MSYQTARETVVGIVEDVLPTDSRLLGEGLRFVHFPDGRAGADCKSRMFWLEANVDGDGGIPGPYTPDLAGQPRFAFALTLTVSYKTHERRSVLDEVMAADQMAYTAALAEPRNWLPTATTCLLSLTNNPLFMPTRRFVQGAKSIEQRTTLAMLFR